MRIVTLEHFRADGPGKILGWVNERGHAVTRVFLDAGHAPPPDDAFDFLVVMGGPMNIYQHRDHPWLVAEKEFIRTVVDAGKPVLGICLGAQLLADVLGGKVMQNPHKEIGWWPVRFSERRGPFADFPAEMTVCHWHGDTFSLPPGATRVAESGATENQGFIIGDRIVAVQFHPELGRAELGDLAGECAAELVPARWVQSREQLLAGVDEAPIEAALCSLLDALAEKCAG